MKLINKVLLALAITSIWQVVSGYVDVFTHRFIFKDFDPPINPSHISLYLASLTGLILVVKMAGMIKAINDGAVKLGIRIALFGASFEVLSGVLNEVYHQVISRLSSNEVLHLAIHGLFVTSMSLVALGGLIICTSKSLIGSSRIIPPLFFSSIWLIAGGSVSYLAFLFSYHPVVILLIVYSFVASLILIPTFDLLIALRPVIFASSFFLVLNSSLIYYFTGDLFILPLPLLAALIIEFVYGYLQILKIEAKNNFMSAVISMSSYFLAYPFSISLIESEGPIITLIVLALGVIAGLVGAKLGVTIRSYLSGLAYLMSNK